MAVTIDGTTGISAVQAGAVESGDLAAGAIGSGDLPAGSVLQVKHTLRRNILVVNTSTPTTVLSISVTPTSSNSKILLLCKLQADHADGSKYAVDWYRNGVAVRTTGELREVQQQDSADRLASHFQYFDSPATTSALTYDVRVKTGGIMQFSHDDFFDSNLTLMEIAG